MIELDAIAATPDPTTHSDKATNRTETQIITCSVHADFSASGTAAGSSSGS
jgi:hypothetical protein